MRHDIEYKASDDFLHIVVETAIYGDSRAIEEATCDGDKQLVWQQVNRPSNLPLSIKRQLTLDTIRGIVKMPYTNQILLAAIARDVWEAFRKA